MGNVTLLSMEGEIIIAKKMKSAKKAFFTALCQSQLPYETFAGIKQKIKSEYTIS